MPNVTITDIPLILPINAYLVRINTGVTPHTTGVIYDTTNNNLFGVDEPMIATPEYNERRIMTYKEFVESDLCKKMVREEKDKEMLLQGEKNENVKKR